MGREIVLGAAFDSSSINSDRHKFNNIELTKHDVLLEEDYKLFRDEGFSLFRESAWLEKTFTKQGINWDWLDRLAKISNKQIQLAISHYNWIDYDGDRENYEYFIQQLAFRYKHMFHSYIPFVES